MSLVGSLKTRLRGEMKVLVKTTATKDICLSQGIAMVPAALNHINMKLKSDMKLSVSLFLSMPAGEIATRPLIEALFSPTYQNKLRVFVPQLHKSLSPAPAATDTGAAPRRSAAAAAPRQVMSMVEVFSLAELDSFPLDSWGIPAPPPTVVLPSSPQAAAPIPRPRVFDDVNGPLLDVVFVPGVAFDEVGGRLGHGKGFYDRFIEQCEQAARLQGRERPYLVGLCLNQQLLPPGERVPMGDHDRYVDCVITQHRTIVANKDLRPHHELNTQQQ